MAGSSRSDCKAVEGAQELWAEDRDAINELREYFHAHGYRCSNADVLRWGVELLLAAKRRQEAKEA